MCVYCYTYDPSKNCGDSCEDHDYKLDYDMTDEETAYYNCSRCGNVKAVDNEP